MVDGRWPMADARTSERGLEYSLGKVKLRLKQRSNGRQEPALKQEEPSEARGAVDPIYLLDSSLSTKWREDYGAIGSNRE